MKNQIVASIAALPFVLGTVFAGAGADQAVAGSFAFSNGADHWFSEVAPGAGDTFEINFNPFSSNFVSEATGPFASIPSPVSTVVPSSGMFEFVEFESPDVFIYELTKELTFDFSPNPDSNITVSWGAGTLFMGMFNTPDSVQFMLKEDQGMMATVSDIGTEYRVVAETLQFSDTDAPGGGTYNGQIDVATPEPTVLFGLGVVTAGLVTSRRKKIS
ncbi:MAG: PEP-CTERM sorting domain-containing protein [Okeania sp. SIO3C4]|nr:PEP-CTERM sorting domain-containing protein [Okeania sp. SIO3C4]